MDIAHGWTAVTAAFLGSLVEAVEALTIVLAVGTVRGWRPALIGTGLGLALLIVAVLLVGPLLNAVPLRALQLAIGILLLLFGMRWLRKAILRAAGVIALHDEEAAYREQTEHMQRGALLRSPGWDAIAIVTSFKAITLEGLEVIFIVIAVGAVGDMLVPASLGAAAACILVAAFGVVLYKPLAQVPENTLKFAVGVLISAFGIFWVGEGLGLAWPGEDSAIVALAATLLAIALIAVRLRRVAVPVSSSGD